MTSALNIVFVDSIHDCDKQDWQSLLADGDIDYPFIQFDYLAALEDSESCSLKNGWQTKHCLIYQDQQLIGLMPCYEKHHSYGEYVFDHQWAQAYQQHGLDYYPKLLTAIPFTPCAGPRLVIAQTCNAAEIQLAVIDAVKALCEEHAYSGWHYLFAHTDANLPALPHRAGVQFHWYNDNYVNFDDYLSHFTSRKRKAVVKERRKVVEQGFHIRRIEGHQASPEDWQRFYHFYQLTYAKRSGHGGYLSEAFFQHIAANFGQACLLVFADLGEQTVAGALYFKDHQTLYGRYWGCYEEFDSLHFECCYYQGIDYCIEKGLGHIDAGAQGEHKIQRGFKPIMTASQHYLQHPGFFDAVKTFLLDEATHIQQYKQDCDKALPFKASE